MNMDIRKGERIKGIKEPKPALIGLRGAGL
jgi:hypothetical protein